MSNLRTTKDTAPAAFWSSYVQYLLQPNVKLPLPDRPIQAELDAVHKYLTTEIKVSDAQLVPESAKPDHVIHFYTQFPKSKLQKAITVHIDQHRRDQIRPTKESASILTIYPTDSQFSLRSQHFLHAIHMKFGVGATEDITCACGHEIKKGESTHHFLGCKKLSYSALTTRHDLIKNAIARFFRLASAPVEVEPRDSNGKYPDLHVTTPSGQISIDVSVVHPLAPSYADKDSDSTILARENSKKQKYREYVKQIGHQFLPAVLDSYGKVGEGLRSVVKEVSKAEKASLQTTTHAKELEIVIQVALHRGNSLAISKGLTHSHRRPRVSQQR